MTCMDQQTFSNLSAEKMAVLDDEQKAIFSMLNEKDQLFFFEQFFREKDLPLALDKKGEILKRNKASRESWKKSPQPSMRLWPAIPDHKQSDDILSAVTAAIRGGAAAAAVATEFILLAGVKPYDLINLAD